MLNRHPRFLEIHCRRGGRSRGRKSHLTRSLVASEGWSLVRDRTNRKHCPSPKIWSYKRDGRWCGWSFDRHGFYCTCITRNICRVAALFSWQMTLAAAKFYSYPVNTRTVQHTARVLDFPAVTFCNLNPLRQSVAQDEKGDAGKEFKVSLAVFKFLNSKVAPTSRSISFNER